MSVSMSAWLTTRFSCACLSTSIPTTRVCQSAWLCVIPTSTPASMSAWLATRFHCACLSTSISPLGCVSLPDLSCWSNQHPGQKWVQMLCTQIWVCTVVWHLRLSTSLWFVTKKSPPLGCVRLADLHVIYQRFSQNGCNCTQIWVFYYSLTPKFASLYLLSAPITLSIEEITPFGVCSKIYLP